MKITLDTDKKLVTIHEEVTFKQLDLIKKLIGENWKEWKFAMDSITVKEWTYYPVYPPYVIPCVQYHTGNFWISNPNTLTASNDNHETWSLPATGTTSINLLDN